MASRVNTRFVVILIAGVIALLGLVVIAASVAYKSASDLANSGDLMMAEGDYRQAELLYSKAVYKDATNTENLMKWVDALEHTTPSTETEYRDRFYNDYIGAIKKTSTILRNDTAAHERFLDIRHEMLNTQFQRSLADAIIEDTNGALAFYNEDPTQVGEWERLKRYRGLAIVQVAKRDGVLDDDQYLLAQEDLERAVAADPTDVESVIGLISITTMNSLRDIPDHDKSAQIEVLKTNIQIAENFLTTYPENIEIAIQRIFLDAEIKRNIIDQSNEGEARLAARIASLESYRDEIKDIADRLLGGSADQLTVQIVKKYYALESKITPNSNVSHTRRMIDTLIETDKNNADLLRVAGSLAQTAGEMDEALGWYSRIEDLETPPMSYRGWRQYRTKRDALLTRASIRINQAQSLGSDASEEELEAAIALATESRDRFASSVTGDNLPLMLIDGKLARAKGDLEESLRLFKKFNEQTLRENLEGLWQEGLVAAQLNRYGVARNALLELIPNETSNRARKLQAMLTLAQIDERLQDYEAAAQLYRDILLFNPSLGLAIDSLERMNKLIHPELNEDPVIAAILTARQIRLGNSDTPADFPGSIALLRKSVVELEYDPRIARELASILFDQNDIEGSKLILTKSLELHPEEEWISKTIHSMDSGDPVAIRIQLIRQSNGNPIDILMSIARIQFENNLKDDLAETMIELNALNPNNKAVIEMNFVQAMMNGDLNEAKSIAERSDISSNDALSFGARIAMAEKDTPKAIILLEQAAASGTADASIFRMLALLQRDNGDLASSIQSFESSLLISPNNPMAIGEYLYVLVRSGKSEEALSTARRLQRHGSSDTNFMNLWLNLESALGGTQGREFATDQREQLLLLNPNDIENKGQLARMYIVSKEWDKSRVLIDEIRADFDSLAMVQLDATWHADQGIVNNRDGLVLANAVYSKYIEGLESPVGTEPYISNAEFMLNRGRPDLAVIAANEAVKHQSPDTMLGSKLLGDLYMRINNNSRAVLAYQEVIEKGADSDYQVRNRLISTLTTLHRYEEAHAIYSQLPEEMKIKMITLLQAADIARGLEDNAGASKLLDDAVSRYPKNSYVYVKRAESMVGDESLLNDLLSDIDRALELQPNDWRAYRVRAAGNFAIGRHEDAIKDLLATIRINPSLDKSIYAILNEFLSQPGRAGEAMDVAREVIASRPDDARMMSRIGGLFASRKEWEHAAEIHGMTWDKRHSVNDGAVYIDSLVRMKRPDAKTANMVITELAKMVGNINQSAGLLAAQALVLQASGREDFAQQQITKAFDLSVDSDIELMSWSRNLSRYFEGRPTQDHVLYLEALKRRNIQPDTQAWLDLFIATRLTQNDTPDSRSNEILERLMEYADNPSIQIRSFKLYGATMYGQDHFDQAAVIWQKGVEMFSDDWEMNNNLAFVLSSELNRLDEALSYGQTSIDQNPSRSEAYETMASIYIQLERFDEAEQMIELGSKFLTTIPSSITMILTSGRLHLARGMTAEARSLLTKAESILRSSPTAYDSLNNDIEEFEQEINSADD